MDYKSFSDQLVELIFDNCSDHDKIIKFKDLKSQVVQSKKHSRHISKLVEILKDQHNLKILDHGCGACVTLIYLFCLGYENIWGIDISCDEKTINNFLKNVCDISENRIFNYDGKTLPFKENSFDLIISQQVLEHVKYNQKKIMIKEQSRVLKSGALAYFQIPHLFVPYEAHTKSWLIHLFPRLIAKKLYKVLNKNHNFFEKHLFLSSPFFYKNSIRNYIGPIKDMSVERISKFDNEFLELKGLSLYIRLFVVKVCSFPFFGKYIAIILSNFIMLEILARNR
tara:strand:+ start:2543 stop:3388 length:846 start_codon:yes stop_codon:yes gene_type:complete